MSQFDLSVLDGLGVGDVAGLGYEGIFSSALEPIGKWMQEFGDFADELPSDSVLTSFIELLKDPTILQQFWADMCKDVLSELLKRANVPSNQINGIIASVEKLFGKQAYAQQIGCVFVIIFFLASFVRGLASPVATVTARGINAITKPNTGDVNDLLVNLFLADKNIDVEALRRDLGIDDKWYAAIKLAAEQRASIAELSERWRRKEIPDDKYREALKKLGVMNDEQANHIARAARTWPTIADVDRAMRTGRVEEATLKSWLDSLGYDDITANFMNNSIRPAYTEADTIRLLTMGEINEQTAGRYMRNIGWSDGDITKRMKLHRVLPPIEELREAFYRGNITEQQFIELLRSHGLQENEAKLLYDNSEILYSPSDLIRFMVREVYSPAIASRFGLNDDFPTQAVEFGERIGLSEQTLRQYWAAHWQLPAPGQGFEMFHRGIISETDLKTLLRALDVMPFWRDRMIQLSYNVIPRRVVNDLWREGIIGDAKFLDQYKQLGFSPGDAALVLAGERSNAELPEREATKGDIIAAYVVGEITEASAKEKLAALGYTSEAIATILKAARVRRRLFEEANEPEPVDEIAQHAPASIRNDILTAYRNDLIGRDVALNLLQSMGIEAVDAITLLAHEDNDREFRATDFKLRQLKRVFDARAIPDQTIADRVSQAGVVPEAQRRIIEQWSAEREADELIASATERQPSRTDLEQWLKKGVIDTIEWSQRMLKLGYSEEIATLYLTEIAADVGAAL